MIFKQSTCVWRGMAAVVAALALTACDTEIPPPFEVEGTGAVEGRIFFDANQDGLYDPSAGDRPLPNVTVVVRDRGTTRTFAGGQVQTDATGQFRVENLPSGTHDLFIDPATLPEGVVCVNPLPVSVFRFEQQFANVRVQIACLIRIADAKPLPLGEIVNVRGVVTAQPGQHRIQGDDMYIQDQSGGIKIFGGVIAGWGVRVGDRIDVTAERGFFGTAQEIQLTNPRLNERVEGVGAPPPAQVTTQFASTQGAAAAPGAGLLVQIRRAQLLGPFEAGGGRNARFNDGSGPVEIRIDPGVIEAVAQINPRFAVGRCYDVVGVLAPFQGAAQIKPRTMNDVQEVPCN
jgi:DNA/RNA endonuclease YhcR with UshA esterase domain